MWAENIPNEFITKILEHCNLFKHNRYVFQTKNPKRYGQFLHMIPADSLLGCTLETTESTFGISAAPYPEARYETLMRLKQDYHIRQQLFITIEPILKLEPYKMVTWLQRISPLFVNIGADSKKNTLPEPSKSDIEYLISEITKSGIEIKEKHNLERLMR
jgi:hypothetical protein